MVRDNCPTIRVLAVDRFSIIACGLQAFFEDSQIELVSNFSSIEKARNYPDLAGMDIVWMDIEFSLNDVHEFSDLLLSLAGPRIVFATVQQSPVIETLAIRCGGYGLVEKHIERDDLLNKLEAVYQGTRLWTSHELSRASRAKRIRNENFRFANLTAREVDVLRQISVGRTNKQAAERLGISAETVKEHVEKTLRKLHVCDRTQAAVWAVRNKVL